MKVLRVGPYTPPYVEGVALIREPGEEPHQYWVTFYGDDQALRLRFVFDVCQPDPLLNALECLWRSEALTSVIDVTANDNDGQRRKA